MFDVIVVGAGNAALCAAISAREQGAAKVLMLEKAPVEERGGNSLFTAGGFRFVHEGLDDLRRDILDDLSEAEAGQIVLPVLPAQTYLEDLRRVTEGQTDDTLSELLVGRSRETMSWMRRNRVRFIPMFGRQSFKVEGKHHFYGGVNVEAVGGGWGLVDQLVRQAERLGVEIRYGTALRRLLQARSGAVTGVHVMGPDGYADIAGRNVVLACGGFEANPEMRVRYYGPGWESCRVRGTRYTTGDGLRAALDIDAQAFGGWSTCHAVQWDISAPPFGDRVVLDNFQKHSYPIGIIVNLDGERFVDEGADYRNHTYAKYGREVMKQPTEQDDDASRDAIESVRGDIVFEDVSFEYDPGVPVLKHVSFVAPAHTTTALVGSSGSGKSTLISLVMAFNHAKGGRVLVDGRDLSTLRLSDYRSHLGIVLQDNFLFDGTIAENIRYGRPDATMAQVLEVARLAHIDEFVEPLEKQYETVIGERGIKLSGGQRQRIAIARAILASPSILILDEATSSLDSESEAKIQDGLRALRRGRTTFVIAHRLSTIRGADQILVLEAGEIVERGTHTELLARNGRYRQLYDRQYNFETDRFINPGEDFLPVGGVEVL